MSGSTPLFRVVIVGAGWSGLEVATRLDAACRAGQMDVVLIEKQSNFVVGGTFQFVLNDRMQPTDVLVPFDARLAKAVRFVKDEVQHVDTAKRVVRTRLYEFPYDELVLAAGIEARPDLCPGLAEAALCMCSLEDTLTIRDALRRIESGRVVISIAKPPYKCPPAPYEWAFVIHDMLKRRGVGDRVEVVVTTPEPQPMPVSGAVGLRFAAMLAEQNIKLMVNTPIKSVDALKHELVLGGEGQAPLHYDLLITMPPFQSPKFLAASGLVNEAGFVPADPLTLRALKIPHAFALGDTAAITLPGGKPHPKAGYFAVAHAEAVAASLMALAAARDAAPTAQSGRAACTLEMSGGVVRRVDADLLSQAQPVFRMDETSTPADTKKAELREVMRRWFAL